MAINVKSERAVAAVKRLATHYGVGYTAAIERAAEEALTSAKSSVDEQTLERVRMITAEYRTHLSDRAVADGDALYDENGLYR